MGCLAGDEKAETKKFTFAIGTGIAWRLVLWQPDE